ncbi:MAG: ORF6N domain-containing protein [Alistipes sp.]|nr:ORF6N domain-containing protein [Alistipes sp.]
MLDFDLAELYQVETRALKQAVRRNIERFPEDFLFRLTKEEANRLITIGVSQNVIPPDYNIGSSEENMEAVNDLSEDMRKELDNIYQAIAALSVKPPQPPRAPIGFKTNDK